MISFALWYHNCDKKRAVGTECRGIHIAEEYGWTELITVGGAAILQRPNKQYVTVGVVDPEATNQGPHLS